jgi:hypothetical protein
LRAVRVVVVARAFVVRAAAFFAVGRFTALVAVFFTAVFFTAVFFTAVFFTGGRFTADRAGVRLAGARLVGTRLAGARFAVAFLAMLFVAFFAGGRAARFPGFAVRVVRAAGFCFDGVAVRAAGVRFVTCGVSTGRTRAGSARTIGRATPSLPSASCATSRLAWSASTTSDASAYS